MSSVNTRHERHAFWQEHVNTCHTSGTNKAHYCRAHGLAYHQFIYWQGKLRGAPTKNTVSPIRCSKLVPIVMPEIEEPSGLQLRLPNGVLISGISKQSVGVVGQLIDQL